MKQIFLIMFVILSYGFELKYDSFESDFNQTVESENKQIFYKGKVFINNNFVFWHYTKPIEKKIWATLDKIYIYEPDLEQVNIYKITKNENLFNLIKDSKKINNKVYLKKYDNKEIYFRTENNMIKKIYYKDKIDNLVTLNFYNTKKREFNLSFFTPKYPDYVDIIYSK